MGSAVLLCEYRIEDGDEEEEERIGPPPRWGPRWHEQQRGDWEFGYGTPAAEGHLCMVHIGCGVMSSLEFEEPGGAVVKGDSNPSSSRWKWDSLRTYAVHGDT